MQLAVAATVLVLGIRCKEEQPVEAQASQEYEEDEEYVGSSLSTLASCWEVVTR